MSNPNHDPKTGQFSEGPGGGEPSSGQRERLRAGLKQIRTEHLGLAAKLNAGIIKTGELSRLEALNQFVTKNAPTIRKLK